MSVGAKDGRWAREREVFQVSNPRAGCAGPTRGSAENNSRVTLARFSRVMT